MKADARLFTDTATIVLFDPARLKSHMQDECDWWTGAGDLEREEAAHNLAYIETGSDGTYNVTVCIDEQAPSGRILKESTLAVHASELVFGPGERLPGEGVLRDRRLAGVSVMPGDYHVVVLETSESEASTVRSFCFVLTKR
ncbi:MAG: DUF6386 family protein [Planctomycetota bacterium]|nr:DUF6386 family protein [Planctomycetota bacterium]